MAGRRKTDNSTALTVDEKITAINKQIDDTELSLKDLKSRRKELEKEKIQQEKDRMYEIMQQHNITPDRLEELVNLAQSKDAKAVTEEVKK